MLQSSPSGVSTCSSSAETSTSRPTGAHTLHVIHVPVCSATYMLHRRALHPVAYETFVSAVTLYTFVPVYTDVHVVISLRTRWYIYFVACATRHALRLRRLLFTSSLCRTLSLHELTVALRMSPPDIRSFIYFRFGCRYQMSDVSSPDAATRRPMFPLPVSIFPMDSYFYT